MPSRMPNWKMRANALVDGMPMTRLCRMPSRGSICMMRTSRSTAVGGHHAVGVEQHREVVVLAPALAEIADIAGLEAGVVVAPPVGERDAPAPACRQRGKARVLGGGESPRRWCRSAHRHGSGSPTPRAASPASSGSSMAGDALGRLVADAQQDRGRRGDRLVAAHAAGRRHDRRHRIARKAHDQEADGRVPEPDHVPGQRHARTARPERDRRMPKPPGESATTASQISPAMVSPTARKNTHRPPGGQGRRARRSRPRRGGSVRACRGFACLFRLPRI